ncbi:uncharacterized protein HMPREF1541_01744 [Cyphellophora europaea CBS 101466]|uniref:SAM-dependent MTase RsmB/NOP-type domain-containing protein n=1 Tax=Cyphellophora europaea (strain CBS 101466) TaxID=1220924 RepID=W2S1M9_CYPE1|nr:uncharacterized protein HMPREF1541_01744 [Cyphellophora europaea CBS 101466]ETN42587.1 hypothetical protein HMPREF1541_01744 [Cyphellophora europaea CBS 101466]
MSLYYDAVTVLSGDQSQGSLKSRVYNPHAGLKSKPAHVYALISESAKYDVFLKEVVDNAGLLAQEPKITPLLSILLLHDHFFAKGGIAASANHALKIAIERHKARLQAEFTKSRLKRKCGTVHDLKKLLLREKEHVLSPGRPQPRWVRINRLRSSLDEQKGTTFAGYRSVASVAQVIEAKPSENLLYEDPHVTDLVAIPSHANMTNTEAYEKGEIILQDKASCFPAQLLLGTTDEVVGDLLDGCAAPGNKTTHLASLLEPRRVSKENSLQKIYACERDANRSRTLQRMVDKARARAVQVLPRHDFLALDPCDARFAKVTHLLLDPSCSGSGIVGRADVPVLRLPADPRAETTSSNVTSKSKKRKRAVPLNEPAQNDEATEEQPAASAIKDPERLAKLADVQFRIVEHAMSFPLAQRITYSTCSIHGEENEAVVGRLLASAVAQRRGWQVLHRDRQPPGLKSWPHRGLPLEETSDHNHLQGSLSAQDLEGCIRCSAKDAEGTMGFFVVGFERDVEQIADGSTKTSNGQQKQVDHEDASQSDWEGFSDGG